MLKPTSSRAGISQHSLRVVAVIACVFVALHFATGHVQAQDKEMTPQQRELLRRKRVARWWKATQATPGQYFMKLNEPLAEANKRDFQRNAKYATQFLEREQEALNKREEEKAKVHAQIAKLFEEYARQNREIVLAIEKGDAKRLNEAFKVIKKVEAGIAELTGRRYRRDWFMPDELRNRTS